MTTRIIQVTKDYREVLDWTLDWSEWLPTGDTIASSSWVVPTGITETSSGNTTTVTSIWLDGGTAGTTYVLVNLPVTASGREPVGILIVKVIDKSDI